MNYRYIIILSLCFVFMQPLQARAGSVASCFDYVIEVIKAKARAKMAYDNAINEEFMEKPDSVLALTCFHKIARKSASGGDTSTDSREFVKDTAGGDEFFSGDFTNIIQPIINASLEPHYKNYETGTLVSRYSGALNFNEIYKLVDNTDPDVTSANFECNVMEDIWEQYMKEGVRDGVPYISFEDLMSDTPDSSGGNDFKDIWQKEADKGVFSTLKNLYNALPINHTEDFSSDESSCQVLVKAGIVASGGCNN